MAQKPQYTKAFAALMAFALAAAGCTKKRDANLPDAEALQTFAISEFATADSSGLKVSAKSTVSAASASTQDKATEEKGQVSLDSDNSDIPKRLRFMFENLAVSGQESQDFKIVFSVDSKFVTAYKLTSNVNSLTKLEKQLAVSPSEVQLSLDLQKASSAAARKDILGKMASAQKARSTSLMNRADVNVLVPLFKYEIQAKGVLERTKNELRESTSTLTLRETEFNKATHIRLATTSDARKDIGSVDQKKLLDQLFSMDALDNKTFTAKELQTRFKFNMGFVADDTKVFTRLDSRDMKVYEYTTLDKLSNDEKRLVKTGSANGEIIKCSEAGVSGADQNCLLRMVAKVPVTYKTARLLLADSKDNTSNSLDLQDVTKKDAQGLVEIARESAAERALPTGNIDPLKTIKMSDLAGEFYFRRTFEDASNIMTVGASGISGDMSIVKFEFERDRVVVRNQKALVQYAGQSDRDKEELLSVPVKYYKLETVDAYGTKVINPKLIDAKKEEADYVEIDWTKNTIPASNTPFAFFDMGTCWQAQTSETVTDLDMRLAKDGVLNFSLASSYTVRPECATQTREALQANYNTSERISFMKRKNAQLDDTQFAPNISLKAQSAMNFAIFTTSDENTSPDVRQGREGSVNYHPNIHDFRNGKVLEYWIGGLTKSAPERRALIEQATREVIAEWNDAFHKAFKGTSLERSGDYVVLHIEDDNSRGRLGDLDKNYLWYFDLPTENGLLGVAQSAPNPYSGTFISGNVMVYSGNSEQQVRAFIQSYTEGRNYEKMLEQAKQEALAEFQKQEAEAAKAAAGAPAAAGSAAGAGDAAGKAASMTKALGSYFSKLILSSRPVIQERATSKYTSMMASYKAGKKLSRKALNGRTIVSDTTITSNKAFSASELRKALSGDFKDDPMMLEAIIAREIARTDSTLSPQIKALLVQQAKAKEMKAKLNQAIAKRGGCLMYTRNDYNDRFLETDFKTLFKNEIKATLLHEVGHSLGLRHNFKASYDKANFKFAGESDDVKRNYTSIMDYIAAPEMEYMGPGTYDVHALRAIYTGLVELSDAAKKIVKDGAIQNSKKESFKVVNNGFIQLEDVKKFFGFRTWADMQKQNLDKSRLLKHYAQCHDELVGIEPACARYDQGASATEIVQNEIQDYHRSYATVYNAGDKINFGWSQKIAAIRRTISTFQTVRGFLDDYFRMALFQTALSQEELQDFHNAAYAGYDFFHEVLRIPNTNLAFGSTPEEIKQRLIPIQYAIKVPVMDKDGKVVVGADGKPQLKEQNEVKILEARRVYDAAMTSMGDRLDTIGIGYDKQFALQFLLTANPAAVTDDSQTGWIGYNEFEQYFLGAENAAQSTNMMTILDIISGKLNAGFVDQNHNIREINMPVTINRNLLDSAVLGAIADTNQYRYPGLDTFAEFFKVGTLKGGRNIKDRLTAVRIGQSSKSAAAVKFFATDNGVGAQALVGKAARNGTLLENKDALAKTMVDMLNGDIAVMAKAQEIVKADPKLKDKPLAEIIAGSEDLKKLQAAGDQAAQELVKALTELNKKSVLVSDEEIKANPNFALDKQVIMLRGMMGKSMNYFMAVKPLLEQVPVNQLEAIIQQLAQEKGKNQTLASNLPLLALGQEVLVAVAGNIEINLKDQGPITGDVLMGIMMDKTPLTSAQEQLMYVIEDLARYTGILNPEYTY